MLRRDKICQFTIKYGINLPAGHYYPKISRERRSAIILLMAFNYQKEGSPPAELTQEQIDEEIRKQITADEELWGAKLMVEIITKTRGLPGIQADPIIDDLARDRTSDLTPAEIRNMITGMRKRAAQLWGA